jgi:nucleotide-binding universal stress UspA family protein
VNGYRHVVVGVAGHAGTARTLAWAMAESVATDAQLVVVHALDAAHHVDRPGSLRLLETVDRSAAGAVAAARRRRGDASVRIVIVADSAGELLVREAGPEDLLVIGGPPRAGWWVRSGTTSQVMTMARCPVIVVSERWELPVHISSRPPAEWMRPKIAPAKPEEP